MMIKTIDYDHALNLIEEAYKKGWQDSLNEPRPFYAARISMTRRHMESIWDELAPYLEKSE